MARRDAEFEGFLRGLETARKIAVETEQDGGRVSKELDKTIRMRRSTGLTVAMSNKELKMASEAMKAYIIHNVLKMSLIVLYEQFGYGAKRLSRFIEEFEIHTNALMDGSIGWEDIEYCLKAETGIVLPYPDELRQQRIMSS